MKNKTPTPEQSGFFRVLLESVKFKKMWPQPPRCPSCGIEYVGHAGLNGTCAALQQSLKVLHQIAEMKSQKRAAAVAGSCVKFIETQIEEGIKRGKILNDTANDFQ